MHLNGQNKFLEMNGVVCIDVRWFQDVGIVIAQDMITKEYKSYIKTIDSNTSYGGPMPTMDIIDADVGKVMAYGARYPLESAKLLFPQYEFIEGDFFEDIIDKYPECFI